MAATATVESFEYAGALGYHHMLIPFLHEVDELRPKVERYLAAREQAGDRPDGARVLAVYHLHVGTDAGRVRDAAERGVMEYIGAATAAHALTPSAPEPTATQSHIANRAAVRTLSFDQLRERNRALAGTPAQVLEQLEFLRRQLSLTDVAGLFALGGLDDEQVRASMRLFMDQVAPRLPGPSRAPQARRGRARDTLSLDERGAQCG
jgi:alkanesulfonate monooxygenase SsuD/methylene tetrahydromethanopterin reductase-like flavin-dependent oxidoreductase (luciferase family)